MILLWGVIFGLGAGLIRSRWNRCGYRVPDVKGTSIVLFAFLPQFLAFFLPATRTRTTMEMASGALLLSQGLLLIFIWLNRRLPPFWLMGAGLVLNLVVISANGGLMPISPDTLHKLAPELPRATWVTGTRFGTTKDIILAADETHFGWLADRFVMPNWYPQRVAFSLGDVFVAGGAFLLFWQGGRCGVDAVKSKPRD